MSAYPFTVTNSYLNKNLTPKETVQVDMMVDGWNDFLNNAYPYIFVHKDQLPQFWEGDCKKHLTNLENFYKRLGVGVEWIRLCLEAFHGAGYAHYR